MRTARAALLAFVLFTPACASNTAAPAPAPPDRTAALKELGEVYRYRAAQQMPAPGKLDALGEQQAVMENAWPLIQDGSIVVAWNVGYSPSSRDVLAYPKEATSSGGPVLLRNGAVKEMTAAEFNAAPKAR
jgi:hypothetical protein